ncbi:TPA: hypothetical protein SMI06_000461 [Serratia marcescens]|nr:hypothetical protein [Serratia marcescens]
MDENLETQRLRNKFEALMQRDYDQVSLERKTTNLFLLNKRDDYLEVEYSDPGAQLMWTMYLAGASERGKHISVTLPSPKSVPDGFYDAGYNEGILDCRRALTSSGIKVRK